jgi:ubiquitin-protein ligase
MEDSIITKRIFKGNCQLTAEIQEIEKNPPEGISLIRNDDDIFDIQAWIQGPGNFILTQPVSN